MVILIVVARATEGLPPCTLCYVSSDYLHSVLQTRFCSKSFTFRPFLYKLSKLIWEFFVTNEWIIIFESVKLKIFFLKFWKIIVIFLLYLDWVWTGVVLLDPKMLRYECQKSNSKKKEKLFLNKIAHCPMCNQKIDVRRRFRVTLSVRMEWFKYFRKPPLLINSIFLLNLITNTFTIIGENCENNEDNWLFSTNI